MRINTCFVAGPFLPAERSQTALEASDALDASAVGLSFAAPMRKRGVLPWKGAPQSRFKEAVEAQSASVARWRWLGLRTGLEGAIAPLGHELIELRAIPGEAQSGKEILELALLIFEPLQRLGAIVVEGAVAACRRTKPVAAAPELVCLRAHHFHLFLQARHLALPAIPTVISAERGCISCIR